MLFDARAISGNETIDTEVCIIGAGPAGLTLAQEFLGKGFRVCVLETGRMEPDEEIQSLSSGEVVGDYGGLELSRRRQVGGMSNEWSIELNETDRGVRFAALDEVDFEQRDWIPYSGWCFDRKTLEPYYHRAQKAAQVGPFAYDAASWETPDAPCLPLQGDRVQTSMFQFAVQSVFNQTYRDRLIQSDNIHLYTNATAIELETDDSGQTVQRVQVACLNGNRFWVAAKQFIITAGGIESARLLLLSHKTHANGLGNQHDVVGRYFMDHPFVCTGEFTPADRQIFNHTSLYDRRTVNGTQVMGKLSLSSEAIRQEKLVNLCAMLFPRYPLYQNEAARAVKKMFMSQYMDLKQSSESEGMRSLKLLGKALQQGKSPREMAKLVTNVGAGLGDIAKATYRSVVIDPLQPNIPADMARCGWSEWKNKEKKFGYFEVWSLVEQTPDPTNRVTLSDQVDRLGCRKSKVEWRWSESDQERIARVQEIMAEDIARSGLGELKLYRNEGKPFLMSTTAHHHIGTTRMHTDPKQGVVNSDCQVHGVSNLHIASSAVFPTGGFANPTLTVLALAIRVGDRINQMMAA